MYYESVSFEVTKATSGDAIELGIIILNEALAFKLSQEDEAWGSDPWTPEEVNHSINAGNTYIARVDGKVAGSVILIWNDERSWDERGTDGQAGYIHRLTTRKEFRGQRVGEKVIAWAEGVVSSTGRTKLRLDCSPHNRKLCRYYEKQGFIAVGRRHFPEDDHIIALYEKSIN